MASRPVWLSILPGALSHGFVVHPPPAQPVVAGYDLANWFWQNGTKGENWDLTFWYTDNQAHRTPKVVWPFDTPGETNIVASCGVHHVGGDFTCGLDGHETPAWDKDAPGDPDYPTSFGDKCDARLYLSKFGGNPMVTQWPQGSEQEVAWAIFANHCGGVGWRLCPLDQIGKDTGNEGSTEQCFQAGHLEFATQETCVRCPSDAEGELDRCFPATTKTDYRGNEWRDLIVDDCYGSGPYCANPQQNKLCTRADKVDFSLVDKVVIPHNLTLGRYALSWRWDTGPSKACRANTRQVWSNCAEVEIIEGQSSAQVV